MGKRGPKADPDAARKPANARVDPLTLEFLDEYAMQENISRGRAIDAAARLLPVKSKRKPKRPAP